VEYVLRTLTVPLLCLYRAARSWTPMPPSDTGAGSLALARMAENRELPDASSKVAEVGLTGNEARELLAGRG